MRQHQLSRGNLTPDGVLLSMEIPHTLGLGFWVMMKRWYASRISRTKKTILIVVIQVEVDELSLQIQSPNVRWLGCIIILSERYLGSTILRRWLDPWGMIWFRLNILCFLRLKLVILTGCRWRWAKPQVENSQSTVGPGMDYHHTGAKSSHVMRDWTWQDLMYCRYNIYTHASAETTLSCSSFCPSHFWWIHFGSEAMVGSCWVVIPRQDLHLCHLGSDGTRKDQKTDTMQKKSGKTWSETHHRFCGKTSCGVLFSFVV